MSRHYDALFTRPLFTRLQLCITQHRVIRDSVSCIHVDALHTIVSNSSFSLIADDAGAPGVFFIQNNPTAFAVLDGYYLRIVGVLRSKWACRHCGKDDCDHVAALDGVVDLSLYTSAARQNAGGDADYAEQYCHNSSDIVLPLPLEIQARVAGRNHVSTCEFRARSATPKCQHGNSYVAAAPLHTRFHLHHCSLPCIGVY